MKRISLLIRQKRIWQAIVDFEFVHSHLLNEKGPSKENNETKELRREKMRAKYGNETKRILKGNMLLRKNQEN